MCPFPFKMHQHRLINDSSGEFMPINIRIPFIPFYFRFSFLFPPKMLRNLSLAILLPFLLSTAFAGPIISDDQMNELIGDENRTSMQKSTSMVSRNQFGLEGENAATCYDSRIAGFINTGLSYYSHNMGQLANYILNQIKVARYGGYWLVHAEMIGGQRQGVQWQSAATGDIFAPSSRHGCYYHDSQTYIIIIQY